MDKSTASEAPSATTRILRVALDAPLRRSFDYLPPEAAALPAPGTRVRVPFGSRRLIGLVLEHASDSERPLDKLRAATATLDLEPIVDAALLTVLRKAADYYHHPIGEVVAAALPKALRDGAPAKALEDYWTLAAEGAHALESGEPRRAPAQRRLLERIAQGGCEGASAAALDTAFPRWRSLIRTLMRRGWIASGERVAIPIVRERLPGVSGALPEPTAEQSAAIGSIAAALDRFGAWLLHGVTGSGKTEVYMRLIERVLALGRGALVLVPEIGLTPQLIERFRERFDAEIAVLHSALTDQERLEAWRAAWSGRARIVLGTRSAIFAPLPALGLIVVDEEHDASFKQHDGGFRYSARDLAIVRARQDGVPVVLGSATPSLESLHNVESGRYVRLALTQRATQAQPPRVTLVDLRRQTTRTGLSGHVLQSIERHLEDDGQVLVFINRRGYAPTLVCIACGWVAPCRDCDARLTVHRRARRLRCHHCGADAPLPERCPKCGFEVKPIGQGTERIEEALAEIFPHAPLARLDRDTVRQRGDLENVVARVASGEARILVGTQMVTKGHHFPSVTLVVVLNGDQGLFSTDFRAAERLAQTIVQVGGRAGRGVKPGEVLVQTEYPEHPLLASLLAGGYEGFARAALMERAAAHWPPFCRLAALRASSIEAAGALEFLRDARRCAQAPPRVKLRGPVPAAMARRAGRTHAQLLVECPERGPLHRFIDAWLPSVESLPSARRVRWALDVDPLELF